MRKEIHAWICKRWWLVAQGLKCGIQLVASHLHAPAGLIVNKLVPKANDKGSTLERLGATLERWLAQEVQDYFEPRQRILIINYVGERRQELLCVAIRSV